MSQNNSTKKYINIKGLKERESIETMLKVNTPIKTIAKCIGVGERTIRNQIKRGKVLQQDSIYDFKTKYTAEYSQTEYEKRYKTKVSNLKIGKNIELAK